MAVGRVLLRVSWGQARNDNSVTTLAGADLRPRQEAPQLLVGSLFGSSRYYCWIVDDAGAGRHFMTTRA